MASPTSPVYYYSSTAPKLSLAASVSGSSATILVNTVAGLPSLTPFKLVVDPGLDTEEIVKVTEVAGTTLTVVRGWDGTGGQAHANLAEVRHMVTAEDLRLSREHEAASSDVHGAVGAVVGATDTQALTNKDLSSPTNTFPPTLATDSEVAAAITAHASSKTTHGVSGDVMGTSSAQTVTNKDLTSTSNTFPATLATSADLTAHAGDTAAHGATGGVVGATKVQALTGKTIDGGSNTLSNIPQSAVTGLPALATSVSTNTSDISALKADTGVVTSAFTVAAGWALAAGQARKVGRVVQVYLRLDRTGGTIAGNSSGDITNVTLGTMSAGYIPLMPTSGGSVANGPAVAALIWTDGGVGLSALPPGVSITNGDGISLGFTYLV